jgi:hypothetical protein
VKVEVGQIWTTKDELGRMVGIDLIAGAENDWVVVRRWTTLSMQDARYPAHFLAEPGIDLVPDGISVHAAQSSIDKTTQTGHSGHTGSLAVKTSFLAGNHTQLT